MGTFIGVGGRSGCGEAEKAKVMFDIAQGLMG